MIMGNDKLLLCACLYKSISKLHEQHRIEKAPVRETCIAYTGQPQNCEIMQYIYSFVLIRYEKPRKVTFHNKKYLHPLMTFGKVVDISRMINAKTRE